MAREYDKKVKRLIRLYDRFYSGQRVYPPDLAEEFGVSLRSLQRDLAELQELYLPIRTVEIENRQNYVLMETARRFPVTFSLADLIVVILSLRMMEQYEGTGLTGYLSDLATKISDRLSQAASDRAINLKRKLFSLQPFPRNFSSKEDSVDDILTALVQEKKLKIKYQPLSGKAKTHTVCPYCLLTYKSGLYLLAQIDPSPTRPRPTVFALERILKCSRLEDSFTLADDWDPAEFLPELGGLFPGTSEKVEIEFDASLRVYLKNMRWPGGCRLTKARTGKLSLKGIVNINEEFVHWIIGFGPSAMVISPPSLKDRIKKHLSETLKQYS